MRHLIRIKEHLATGTKDYSFINSKGLSGGPWRWTVGSLENCNTRDLGSNLIIINFSKIDNIKWPRMAHLILILQVIINAFYSSKQDFFQLDEYYILWLSNAIL